MVFNVAIQPIPGARQPSRPRDKDVNVHTYLPI